MENVLGFCNEIMENGENDVETPLLWIARKSQKVLKIFLKLFFKHLEYRFEFLTNLCIAFPNARSKKN